MKDKAGSMGAGAVWLFALIGIVLGVVVLFATKSMSFAVTNAIFFIVVGACGWAGVFLTKASAGKGILAFLVASLGAGIASYFLVSMLVASVTSTVTTGMATGVGADNAQAAQAGAALGSAMGAMVGILAALKTFIVFFAAGIAGSIAGGKFKAAALGQGGAAAKAA
jgi:hypothetical protein